MVTYHLIRSQLSLYTSIQLEITYSNNTKTFEIIVSQNKIFIIVAVSNPKNLQDYRFYIIQNSSLLRIKKYFSFSFFFFSSNQINHNNQYTQRNISTLWFLLYSDHSSSNFPLGKSPNVANPPYFFRIVGSFHPYCRENNGQQWNKISRCVHKRENG